ncbi:MAG: FAD-binding oxidoreductase [Burkholderiales bacterium]|nr:FAD-binding oxidoreductase [Burkholderiales bacterium]
MTLITITPANLVFAIDENEDILSAAIRHNINLPHGCQNGECGSCKAKITCGEAYYKEIINSNFLSEKEIADGYYLLCKTYVKTDCTIKIPGFFNLSPIRTMPSKITNIDKFGTTAIVKLKLPAAQKFEFQAGQYIDVIYENQTRSYSIANSPNYNELELHIRYHPGGLFSQAIWNDLQIGSLIRFRGPLGNFTLRDSDNPILMVCTGTGIAPIKGLLEYMISTNNTRQIHLIWGDNIVEDFYLKDMIENWKTKLDLTVNFCTMEQEIDGYYHGMVTEFVAQNYTTLANHEVYACGNPKMIEDIFTFGSTNLQLTEDNFYSDSFTPSKQVFLS